MRFWCGLPALAIVATLTAANGAAAAPALPAAACSVAAALPPELADWARNASSKTIYAYGDDLGADWSPLGPARTALPLHKFESLRYGVAPERKPDVYKFGGMIPVAVVKSVTHGHGPACSGIRKMVEFDVKPGRYQLQIVNAPAASIHAMAVLRD